MSRKLNDNNNSFDENILIKNMSSYLKSEIFQKNTERKN